MILHALPAVNATLNAIATVLLVTAYVLILNRRVDAHRRIMIAAFATSSLFLICYVVYHAQVGSVRFTRQGFVRPLYFVILITHVTLAATVPPLAIITLAIVKPSGALCSRIARKISQPSQLESANPDPIATPSNSACTLRPPSTE